MQEQAVAAGEKISKARMAAFKGYKDGSADFMGDQIESLLGYTRKEFDSRAVKLTDLFVEEDRERAKKIFIQALKGDKTYVRELRFRKKSGEVIWIREWGQIVCDENGQIEFSTGIAMDITEEKQQEQLLLDFERKTGKYLTFSIAGEEYGISIRNVKRIVALMPITPLPESPAYVKGVINLRGKVIPVVDLRIRLGIEECEYTARTCIIVVETTRNGVGVLTGVLVDSISEVLHINGADIEDRYGLILQMNSHCMLGMAKVESGLKIILDVDKVLGDVEGAVNM
ncbi:MAG: chemotaxis protein CheW [Syntrophobacteraceae bacterium]